MPESLIPPRRPAVEELLQARKTLLALQEYLESPDGIRFAGKDFVDLHSSITLVELAIQRFTIARQIP